MVRFGSTLLFAVAALSALRVPALAADPKSTDPASPRTFSVEELRSDFDSFAGILLSRNPLVNVDRAELVSFIAERRVLLRDGMDVFDFSRILMPIIAKIGCGHSGVNAPAAAIQAKISTLTCLPLAPLISGGRIYVASSLGAAEPEAGSEITAINGKRAREIVDTFLENIPADAGKLTGKYYVINNEFTLAYHLFFGSADSYAVEYSGRDGLGRVVLRGVPWTDFAALRGDPKYALPVKPAGPDPKGSIGEDGIGVLRVGTFNYYDSASLAAFRKCLADFFRGLADRRCGSLIIDLRGNSGGSPDAASSLFTYLLREPEPYFSPGTYSYYHLVRTLDPAVDAFAGKLYVLIDGGSFSSTGHLCSLIRYHNLAVFVGEESGGGFSCTDGSESYTLKNSRVILRSSTQEFKTAVKGQTRGRGISPDYECSPSIDDIIAGRDVVMECARRLAAERN